MELIWNLGGLRKFIAVLYGFYRGLIGIDKFFFGINRDQCKVRPHVYNS